MESKYGKITVEKKEIPADEPLFLLRAQDKLAAGTIRYYAEMRRTVGDKEAADHCLEVAKAFDAWPNQKMPD